MLANAPTILREMMKKPGLIWGPGVFDGISARIASAAGFPMLYMTGSGTAASRIGQPDLGITSLTEMVDNARTIASVANVPVVADGDTGFGGPNNVARTVRLYEQAGVAAIHIEDQTFPKKCGHLTGKTVVGVEEFLQRIRAAARARTNPDFVIIARTDAREGSGFDEAIGRIIKAFDAGADVGFFEAPETLGEIETLLKRAPGPMLMNIVANGRSPAVSIDQAEKMGFKFAILPAALTRPAVMAMQRACEIVKSTGTDREVVAGMSPRDFFNVMGMAEAVEIDAHARGEHATV